jgi:chromosome segregation ATPase
LSYEIQSFKEALEQAHSLNMKLEGKLKAVKQDLEETSLFKTRVEQENQGLKEYIQSQSSDNSNAESFLTTLKNQRDSLQQELEALKLKQERDKGKLRFYKNEYFSFELQRKAFEEDLSSYKTAIFQKDRQILDLNEREKRL